MNWSIRDQLVDRFESSFRSIGSIHQNHHRPNVNHQWNYRFDRQWCRLVHFLAFQIDTLCPLIDDDDDDAPGCRNGIDRQHKYSLMLDWHLDGNRYNRH